MKVICINSSNKPKEIPFDQWIIEGEEYTITKIVKMGLQGNKLGVLLKEIQLGEDCFPYEYYDADRFIPMELIKQETVNIEAEEFSI